MVDRVLFSSNTYEWGTPFDFYKPLHKAFHFTLDPCTTPDNPLGTKNFYTISDDGLLKDWSGSVFVNYPYGRKTSPKWAEKIVSEFSKGKCEYMCVLAPNRSETKPLQHMIQFCNRLVLVRGRVPFVGAGNSPPFGSYIIVYSLNKLTSEQELTLQTYGLVMTLA